ncbi:MAG: hypothetical protein WCG25_04485 [bacterium]
MQYFNQLKSIGSVSLASFNKEQDLLKNLSNSCKDQNLFFCISCHKISIAAFAILVAHWIVIVFMSSAVFIIFDREAMIKINNKFKYLTNLY